MQKNEFNGWLLVDKPAGMTSADVVRVLKKRYNLAKIGHAGTLDPDATGLIPLALGEATKAIPYLLNARKNIKLLLSMESKLIQMMLLEIQSKHLLIFLQKMR